MKLLVVVLIVLVVLVAVSHGFNQTPKQTGRSRGALFMGRAAAVRAATKGNVRYDWLSMDRLIMSWSSFDFATIVGYL